MNGRRALGLCAGLLLAVITGGGCRQKPGQEGSAQLQVVTVSRPIVRKVYDQVDYQGQTAAKDSVDIRARVTGYLHTISFQEGAEVRKDDVLIVIDQRPFKAQWDRALAQVKVCIANRKYREADVARAKALLPQNAMSQSDYDQIVAAYGEAAASVDAAEASAHEAELNFGFTTVASPIDGRISRADITVGNLVRADDTLLTTVVSQDPMYVYFDVDERTMLRVMRTQMAAKENLLKTKGVKIFMRLEDEEGFPHAGYIDFADNVVDPTTGTVTVRGVFDNPAGPSGARLLRPGMFARVRLPLGEPQEALLVAERALVNDQGKKYLLVVDDQQKVQYRPIEVGPVQDDGLRVITKGLRPDERVIISGLQLVQREAQVQAEEAPMPTSPGARPAPLTPGGNTAPSPVPQSH